MSSGTTGLPKAIPTSWAILVSRSKNLGHYYGEFGHKTLHFNQFWALNILRVFIEGHTLYIYDPKLKGISGISTFLTKYEITLMVCFTALFREIKLTEDLPMNNLQAIVIAGELGLVSDIERFESLTGPQAFLNALYGSSEYAIMSSYIHRHGQAMSFPAIPLGKVPPSDDLRVVDADGHPVRPYVRGEIIVVSDVIPDCYLNNPEQSAVAFRTLSHSGERAYFTGDMGYFDSERLLHSTGRKDDQVKIRGNLVNILEVEHVLSTVFETDEMAVSSNVGPNGQNHLACYYVADEAVVIKVIKDQLRKQAPSHMIPSYFHKVDKLPRTASGKVMRRALHELRPETQRVNHSQAVTEHEKIVNNVMAKVLGHSDFGRGDDFFDVGGDSLAAMTLTFKLEARFGINLPLEGLFLEGASVELMASRIAGHAKNAEAISLVPLNYASTDRVFYALPTLNGRLSDYVVLGEAMSASAKIVGIRFNRLFSSVWGKPLSLEKVATEAANKILKQTGNAEINLIGFSAAGLLAYETAKVLHKQGYKVENLILIDSHPYKKIIKWPILLRFFAANAKSVSRKVRRKEKWVRRKTYSQLYLENQLSDQCITPIFVNRLILFTAELGGLTSAEIKKWRGASSNKIQVTSIKGDHFGVRKADVASDIAQTILR